MVNEPASPSFDPTRPDEEVGLPWSPGRVAALSGAVAVALVGLALAFRSPPELFRALVGAAAVLGGWGTLLAVTAKARGRSFRLAPGGPRELWAPLLGPAVILAWWAAHVEGAAAFAPLVVAQALFALAVDLLLQWSRREGARVSGRPVAVALTVNLFLWFRPERLALQFAMVGLAVAAEGFFRQKREGRRHPLVGGPGLALAVATGLLAVADGWGITLVPFINGTQHHPPLMYVVVLLACAPAQILFGGAMASLGAVVATYAVSLAYLGAAGTYLFLDSHVPLALFLGAQLLAADPTTAPRPAVGALVFGAAYGVVATALYAMLAPAGVPLLVAVVLPVPVLGLVALAMARVGETLGAAPLPAPPPTRRAHAAYTGVWAAVFCVLALVKGVGDRQAGQYLPSWQRACDEGIARACERLEHMTLVYCNDGSGWACNEWGVLQVVAGKPPGRAFHAACDLGFQPACANTVRNEYDAAALRRGDPGEEDLPIVLRGSRPQLEERDPERLRARACRQGWAWACGADG